MGDQAVMNRVMYSCFLIAAGAVLSLSVLQEFKTLGFPEGIFQEG